MSKYIRIDNGVYKVGIDKEAKESGISNYYYIEVDKGVRLTFDEEELNKGKLGDTIKELCDEFVIIGSGPFQQYIKISFKEALKKKEWLKKLGYSCEIYGAIWTDKGLIYVAEMNKKNELELI